MLVRQFKSLGRIRLAPAVDFRPGKRIFHGSKFVLHGHSHHDHSHGKSSSQPSKSAPETSFVQSIFGHGHSHGSGGHGHSHGGPLDVEDKSGALRAVTVYGAVVNVALSVGKGIAGVMGNSSAMIADAAHSLSDLISDFVTIWVLKEAHKPPDHDHPYGHGKFESIGSLSLATILIGTGVGIGLHSLHILQDAQNHLGSAPTALALGAAVVSVIVKEALYHITVRVGQKHNSTVVVLNAWHHRADGLTSLVALAGIGGSMMGFPWMDPVAGILVAGMIVRIGVQSGIDSFRDLTDAQVDGGLRTDLEALLGREKGVQSFHRLRLRRTGPNVIADVHIVVDPLLSVSAAHQIAERVRLNVMKERPEVREILVHVDVHNDAEIEEAEHHCTAHLGRPAPDVEEDVRKVMSHFPAVLETVRITCDMLSNGKVNVLIKVRMDPTMTIEQAAALAMRAQQDLLNEIHDLQEAQVLLDLVHIAQALRQRKAQEELQKQQQEQQQANQTTPVDVAANITAAALLSPSSSTSSSARKVDL